MHILQEYRGEDETALLEYSPDVTGQRGAGRTKEESILDSAKNVWRSMQAGARCYGQEF